MTTLHRLFALPLILLTMASGSAYARQQHIVNPAQLAAAVAEKVAAQDTDRAAVREALARPEVRAMAASMGVDPERMATAAEALRGSDLEQAAAAAKQVNEQLVGGASTLVISTTTLIIILLVLILLIVALK
jgi:hypothetical protein